MHGLQTDGTLGQTSKHIQRGILHMLGRAPIGCCQITHMVTTNPDRHHFLVDTLPVFVLELKRRHAPVIRQDLVVGRQRIAAVLRDREQSQGIRIRIRSPDLRQIMLQLFGRRELGSKRYFRRSRRCRLFTRGGLVIRTGIQRRRKSLAGFAFGPS